LSKAFGGVQAVQVVDLEVSPAAVVGLIGPNGAGKSTVLGMLAGAIRPDRGRVVLAGREVAGRPSHRMAQLGVIRTFQTASVFPQLTVLENLLLGVKPWRGERPWWALLPHSWRAEEASQVERARQMLERLGLTRHTNDLASSLSGGERRLLEIGRALLAEPVVLLLDEPMAGVAPHLAEPLAVLIEGLSEEGTAVILVEHEMRVIDRLCHSVVVMAGGKVIMRGTLDEVRANQEVRMAYLGQ
jgi:ABC-type branched-subunit amino acid transport system ATPase component